MQTLSRAGRTLLGQSDSDNGLETDSAKIIVEKLLPIDQFVSVISDRIKPIYFNRYRKTSKRAVSIVALPAAVVEKSACLIVYSVIYE